MQMEELCITPCTYFKGITSSTLPIIFPKA